MACSLVCLHLCRTHHRYGSGRNSVLCKLVTSQSYFLELISRISHSTPFLYSDTFLPFGLLHCLSSSTISFIPPLLTNVQYRVLYHSLSSETARFLRWLGCVVGTPPWRDDVLGDSFLTSHVTACCRSAVLSEFCLFSVWLAPSWCCSLLHRPHPIVTQCSRQKSFFASKAVLRFPSNIIVLSCRCPGPPYTSVLTQLYGFISGCSVSTVLPGPSLSSVKGASETKQNNYPCVEAKRLSRVIRRCPYGYGWRSWALVLSI